MNQMVNEHSSPTQEGESSPKHRPSQLLAMSAYWFGTNAHWTALLLIILPSQVADLRGSSQATSLGALMSIGAIFSLIVPLIVGPLSDRCTSKWGRRRPYIAVGTAVNLVGLLGMYLAAANGVFWGYLLAYLLVQTGNNIATGAYNGVIPDLVSPSQRGTASGYMALMTQLGSALGAVGSGLLMGAGRALESYAVITLVLAGSMLATLLGVREEPLRERPEKKEWSEWFKSLHIECQRRPALGWHLGVLLRRINEWARLYPDFTWVWITRALVMLGFYTVQPFVQYYLRDVIGVANPEKTTQELFLIILIGATVSGFLGGWISDKTGRKRIVYIANALMAIMAVGLVFCRTLPQALTVGVLFGFGYGAYISVDWALGTDVLPNKEDAGKDMAIWHIAMVLPQSIAAPLAGLVLQWQGHSEEIVKGERIIHYNVGGFMWIFSIAAGFLVLGAVLLRNVRGAR
jgi:MFS family permease